MWCLSKGDLTLIVFVPSTQISSVVDVVSRAVLSHKTVLKIHKIQGD